MANIRSAIAGLAAVAALAAAQPAQAQHQQAISANPFGLLLEIFNGEYERVVAGASTAGFGGSYFTQDDLDYLNADVFYRYYPQGDPLDGWAFGGKVGLTNVDGGSYFGYGFDVNRSWLLGESNNFYVGVGIGLKKLVGTDEEDDLVAYIPTFRIVNIGFAF